MTYEEVVLRMVRLMYVAHQGRWVDVSLRNLAGDWLRRIEERFVGVTTTARRPPSSSRTTSSTSRTRSSRSTGSRVSTFLAT